MTVLKGARVSKIAAKVLATNNRPKVVFGVLDVKENKYVEFTWSDIRALAASALTQTADKRELNEAIRELQQAACDREGVPMPSQRERNRRHDDIGFLNQARKRLGLKPLATGPARILSKTASSWPPSAKPPRKSP